MGLCVPAVERGCVIALEPAARRGLAVVRQSKYGMHERLLLGSAVSA